MKVEIGTILFDECSGNYFRVDSEYKELQHGYWCTQVELDDDGEIISEESSGWRTKKEVESCIDNS